MHIYSRSGIVDAKQMDEDFEINYPNGSKVFGKAGDYVVTENGFKVYYSKDAFESIHTEYVANDLVAMYMSGQQELLDKGFYNSIGSRNYEDEGVPVRNGLRVAK